MTDQVSSSSDLNPRLIDFSGSRTVLSKSKVSTSELPINVPHLQIEKIYMKEDDFGYAKSALLSGSSVAGILHICDDDDQTMMVALGKRSELPVRQEIRSEHLRDLQRGQYFCIWNTTPVKINTTKRRTTVKYPLVFLFSENLEDEESYINIYSDDNYHAWFPILLPHAMKLLGDNLDNLFRNVMDSSVAQFGHLYNLYEKYYLSSVYLGAEERCSFRVTITKEPLESDPVRVIPLVENGICTNEHCDGFAKNSGLFLFEEWLMKWSI